MSASPWKPKWGDPRPPDSYTQTGPHAYCDESELARRREAWHAMMSAPPPDPPKGEAPEAATTEASGTEQSRRGQDDMLIVAPDTHGPAPDQYAIDWAFDQDTDGPGPKLVLVALARHCFKPGDALCWPSIGKISRLACMGRTAVGENLTRLQELGLIQDTGTRRGATGRVIVWRLGNSAESGLLNGSESGPLNGSESGPLGRQSSGFRAGMVRNPDTEYPPKGGGGGAASAVAGATAAAPRNDLPTGLDPELFALWVDGRPEREVQKLIAQARVLDEGGHDLNALCRQAISNRWAHWPRVDAPSKPRVAKVARTKPATHSADDWGMPS